MSAAYTEAEAKRTERELNENFLRAHKRAEGKALRSSVKIYSDYLKTIVPAKTGALRAAIGHRIARQRGQTVSAASNENIILPSRQGYVGVPIAFDRFADSKRKPPHVYFRFIDLGTVQRFSKPRRLIDRVRATRRGFKRTTRRGRIMPGRYTQRASESKFQRAALVYSEVYGKIMEAANHKLTSRK